MRVGDHEKDMGILNEKEVEGLISQSELRYSCLQLPNIHFFRLLLCNYLAVFNHLYFMVINQKDARNFQNFADLLRGRQNCSA